MCPIHVYYPENRTLDLRSHFEAIEGIWCPMSQGCDVWEFFVDEDSTFRVQDLEHLAHIYKPVTILFD